MAGNKKRKKNHKKHCSSKREVFQMVQQSINEKNPQRRQNTAQKQLQLINRLKPAIEAAREEMRKQGKYVLVPDAEKYSPKEMKQEERA